MGILASQLERILEELPPPDAARRLGKHFHRVYYQDANQPHVRLSPAMFENGPISSTVAHYIEFRLVTDLARGYGYAWELAL